MKAKIAVAQMYITNEPEQNRAELKKYMEKAGAAGVDFFVCPETWPDRYETETIFEQAEPVGGPSYQVLKEGAEKYGMYVIGGSIATLDGDKVSNRSYIFGRDGSEIGHYNKIHMFDIITEDGEKLYESETYRPGDEPFVFDTEFGKVGVTICYDVRFSGLFVKLAEEGADIIFLPAAFTNETGQKHWLTLTRARALDSQCFFVGCGVPYMEDARISDFGHSVIWGPWGEELMLMDEKPGMTVTEIDLDLLKKARGKLPVLAGQRHDLY